MHTTEKLPIEYQNLAKSLSTKWTKQLKKVSPALQDELIRINSDSRMLKKAFDFSFLAPGELNALLGAAFISLLTNESVRNADDEYREKIIGLHRNLTTAINYLESQRPSPSLLSSTTVAS